MDLADIRNLVLQTQASILENVFPGSNEAKHVSVGIQRLALSLSKDSHLGFWWRSESSASASLGLAGSRLQKWRNQKRSVVAAALRRGRRRGRERIQLEERAFEMNGCVLKDPLETINPCRVDGSHATPRVLSISVFM